MTTVSVGESFVTVTPSNGRPVTAAILEKLTGPDGTVYSVLLDRVVHESHWAHNERTWEATGVFVTELRLKGYEPAATLKSCRAELLEVLGDEDLVTAVERAVEESAPDGWRDNLMKRRTVEGAVAAALGDRVKEVGDVMAALRGSPS